MSYLEWLKTYKPMMGAETPPAPNPEENPPESQEPPESGGTNWQERYENLQPEFTRTTQELATYRELVTALQDDDPDVRRYAHAALGIEFQEPEPQEDLSALEQLQQGFEELRNAFLSQQQQSQTQAALDLQTEHVANQLAEIDAQLGRELTDEEVQIVSALAAINRDQNGMPDAHAAWKVLTGYDTSAQQRWAQTKKAPKIPSNGRPGESAPNLDNDKDRLAWMVEQAEARLAE